VTTLAGSGTSGSADGIGTNAQFNNPFGLAVDNDGNVYVSDDDNIRIRKITSEGIVGTFVVTSENPRGIALILLVICMFLFGVVIA